jgi:hypothetical protein
MCVNTTRGGRHIHKGSRIMETTQGMEVTRMEVTREAVVVLEVVDVLDRSSHLTRLQSPTRQLATVPSVIVMIVNRNGLIDRSKLIGKIYVTKVYSVVSLLFRETCH